MQRKHLMLAERITDNNGKISATNIFNQFNAEILPANFNFDLAFICGPGWPKGNYDICFKIKLPSGKIIELGIISINIPDDKFVYNALANNLNFKINENTEYITFIVERNDKIIYFRDYYVITTN